jgi:hypothetical protein
MAYQQKSYTPKSQTNGMEDRQKKDRQTWGEMLQAMSKMNEKQAAGYIVGRALNSLWMNHLAKRHDPNEQKRREAERLKKQAEALQGKNAQLKAGMDGLQQQNAAPWRGGLSYSDNAGNVYGATPTADPNEGIISQIASQMGGQQEAQPSAYTFNVDDYKIGSSFPDVQADTWKSLLGDPEEMAQKIVYGIGRG